MCFFVKQEDESEDFGVGAINEVFLDSKWDM